MRTAPSKSLRRRQPGPPGIRGLSLYTMRHLLLITPLFLCPTSSGQELSLHFRCDEGVGSGLRDTSLGDHHGSIGGGFSWTGGATAASGGALSLDGTATALVAAGPDLDALAHGFTLLGWVRYDGGGGRQTLFGNPGCWSFDLLYGEVRLACHGNTDHGSGVQVPVGAWVHVGVVFASDIATFYFDGNPLISIGGTGTANAAGDWWLGSRDGASQLFTGGVDDLMVFEGALDHSRMLWAYEHPGAPPVSSTLVCDNTPNSTGAVAQLIAVGSSSVGANLLDLYAEPVPDGLGLVFMGSESVPVPFGNGTLCVGVPLIRLDPALAALGRLDVALDMRAGMGPGLFLAGNEWTFQAWFQDAGSGAGFGFSSAASIRLTP